MARMKLKTGTEGPRSDPYAFGRLTFERTDGVVVTYHAGLGEWCRVEFKTGPIRKFEWTNNAAAPAFEQLAGISVSRALKIINRVPTRCKTCRSRKLAWLAGYPGESLLCCQKCDAVVASSFNESAII